MKFVLTRLGFSHCFSGPCAKSCVNITEMIWIRSKTFQKLYIFFVLFFSFCPEFTLANYSYSYKATKPQIILNPLMPDGNQRSYMIKQAYSLQLYIRFSVYDLLLPPAMKGLMNYKKDSQINITLINTN